MQNVFRALSGFALPLLFVCSLFFAACQREIAAPLVEDDWTPASGGVLTTTVEGLVRLTSEDTSKIVLYEFKRTTKKHNCKECSDEVVVDSTVTAEGKNALVSFKQVSGGWKAYQNCWVRADKPLGGKVTFAAVLVPGLDDVWLWQLVDVDLLPKNKNMLALTTQPTAKELFSNFTKVNTSGGGGGK